MYEIEKQIKTLNKIVKEKQAALKNSIKQVQDKEEIKILQSIIKRLSDINDSGKQKELFQ